MCRSIKTLRPPYATTTKEDVRAAALQFVVAHPSVVSVIPGPVSMAEMTENIRMMQHTIPPDLWADMVAEGLILSDCPLPAR